MVHGLYSVILWTVLIPTYNLFDSAAFADVSDILSNTYSSSRECASLLRIVGSVVVEDSIAHRSELMCGAWLTRFIATVFGSLFLSILTVGFCTLMMLYGPDVRDWSLLYSFVARASAPEFDKVRRGGFSRNTYALGVRRRITRTRWT